MPWVVSSSPDVAEEEEGNEGDEEDDKDEDEDTDEEEEKSDGEENADEEKAAADLAFTSSPCAFLSCRGLGLDNIGLRDNTRDGLRKSFLRGLRGMMANGRSSIGTAAVEEDRRGVRRYIKHKVYCITLR